MLSPNTSIETKTLPGVNARPGTARYESGIKLADISPDEKTLKTIMIAQYKDSANKSSFHTTIVKERNGIIFTLIDPNYPNIDIKAEFFERATINGVEVPRFRYLNVGWPDEIPTFVPLSVTTIRP